MPKKPTAPSGPSHLTSTQCLTTLTSVPSSINLMEFLPSSCVACFLTSTLPFPPASLISALLPASGLPTTCFSLMNPFLIFSSGHPHSTHWSSMTTSWPLGKRASTFFGFMSFVGAFLTMTCMAPEALFKETLALASGSLSVTSPLNRALAFSASWLRSFRGTLSFMCTWPWASGSNAFSPRSSGIWIPRSFASGAQRSATFFLNASGTLAKYWQSSLDFRLPW
mmetsp:Transcript_71241/g.159493  ORF Transcript_71241/g.159493 Transcript_71241/m.159493 type:complete len:224 (-) Transcript_71241:609-1280(-)